MEQVILLMNQLVPVGQYLMKNDLFPFFFFADFTISSILVRDDSKNLGPKFRQKHPFTSWLCTVITTFSGAFVASFFFGQPILDILQENTLIALMTLAWYLINYSPFDIYYKLVMLPVIITPFSVLQECVRLRFIYLGVQAAATAYPKAPLIILMGGIIKGNGYGLIKIVERLVRGVWEPKTNEFLELSYFTKSGLVASFLFLIHHNNVLPIPIESLYSMILVVLIIGRLILVLANVNDPLSPIEAPFCRLLFGTWEEPKPSKRETKEFEEKGEGDINQNNSKKKNSSNKNKQNKKKD